MYRNVIKRYPSIIIAIVMILSVLSFVATPEQSCMRAFAAEDETQPPVIINASWKGEPGGAIGIYGDGFGTMDLDGKTSTEVAIQPLTGFVGKLSPEGATLRLTLVNVQNNVIQGVLPDNLPVDLYALWVKNHSGWSRPVFVNKAEIFWASEHMVVPGQKVRIFGRNFENILQPGKEKGGKPDNKNDSDVKVKLVDINNNSTIDADVLDVSPNAIDFSIPGKMDKGGQYTVMVTNGAGGDYGWYRINDDEALTVLEQTYKTGSLKNKLGLDAAWIADIPHNNMINVQKYGAKGDGQTDDTSAIQTALDNAGAENGGVVYLPEGTYLFSELKVPANTVLLGEGKETTILRYIGGRTPAERVGRPGWTYGEPIFLISSKGDSAGLANLSIINEEKRPAEDKMRRLNGWVLPVAFGYDSTYKIGDGMVKKNHGYFLKNVRIRNVDGAGVEIHATSDIIVENSELYVTHGAINCYADGYVRIRNNTMFNTQRPLILGFSEKQWIEGNDLSAENAETYDGIDPELPAKSGSEHRIMDLSSLYNYVAGNRVTGQFGLSYSNDGEGILWQSTVRLALGTVSAADTESVTDGKQTFTANSLKDANIVIIGGKGIGQMRKVTGNTANKILVDRAWDIIPDETSVYTVDHDVAYHNIVVDNDISAKTNKGGICFYTKDYDNIISGNTLENTGGIWLTSSQVSSQNRADFSYFTYAADNKIKGAANPHYGMGNHVTIGSANDGGVNALLDEKIPSTTIFGSKFLRNEITGIGTDIPYMSEFNKKFVIGSGIMISNNSPVHYPVSQGLIVEKNKVTNTIAGIHLGNTSYDTFIKDNDFTGNGREIDNSNSVNTINMLNGRIFPASPSGVKTEVSVNGNVKISWQHAYRAESYSVARSENLKGPYQLIAEDVQDTEFVDDTAYGKPYYYRLVAKNSEGESIPNDIKAELHMKKIGSYDTDGRSFGISVKGSYAYLADHTGGLKILDVSNPANPSLASVLSIPGKVVDVQAGEKYAYVTAASDPGKSQFLVIDIGNPKNPVIKGSVGLQNGGRIALKGNYAYIADGTTGIRIIDISNPDKPLLKATVSSGNVADIFIKDNSMYLVNYKELKIFDITDPLKPVLTGTVSTRGNSQRVFVSGNYAYIADGTQQKANGMQIVDVSNPANPVIISSFDSKDGTASIYVMGNFAFLGGYFNTMQVVSINDPKNPVVFGTIDSGSSINDIEYSNGYFYLANSFNGLSVISFE